MQPRPQLLPRMTQSAWTHRRPPVPARRGTAARSRRTMRTPCRSSSGASSTSCNPTSRHRVDSSPRRHSGMWRSSRGVAAGGFERNSLIPERAQHLHAVAVVPNRRGHNSVSAGSPDPFLYRGERSRARSSAPASTVSGRTARLGTASGRVADLKAHPLVAAPLGRLTNSGDRSTPTACTSGSAAAANVSAPVPQPTSSTTIAGLYSGEVHEQRRQPATPPSHEPFVAIAFGEHAALRLSTLGVVRMSH